MRSRKLLYQTQKCVKWKRHCWAARNDSTSRSPVKNHNFPHYVRWIPSSRIRRASRLSHAVIRQSAWACVFFCDHSFAFACLAIGVPGEYKGIEFYFHPSVRLFVVLVLLYNAGRLSFKIFDRANFSLVRTSSKRKTSNYSPRNLHDPSLNFYIYFSSTIHPIRSIFTYLTFSANISHSFHKYLLISFDRPDKHHFP